MRSIKQYIPAILILLIGLTVSFLLHSNLVDSEKRVAIENFKRAGNERINTIQGRLNNKLTVIKSIVAFYKGSTHVSDDEFHAFTNYILKNGESIQALEWIPLVTAGKRKEYVNALRKKGYASFRITEKNAQGKKITAGKRKIYYPVYYVAPYKGNEGAHGFDLGSSNARLAALNEARDSAQNVTSGVINLVQLKEKNEGVLIFSPVYSKELIENTVEERRKYLNGFVLAVFRLSNLISGSIAEKNSSIGSKAAGIDIYLYDESDNNKLIYLHQSRTRDNTKAPKIELKKAKEGININHSIIVGGRTWTVVLKPVSSSIFISSSQTSSFLLLLSVLTSFLITFYFISTVRRTNIVEEQVKQRTEDLNHTVEIANTKEQRIRAIVDNTGEGIITMNGDGVISTVNTAFINIFGYSKYNVLGSNIKSFISIADSNKDISIEKMLSSKKTHEVFGVHENGKNIPLEITLSSVEIENKKMFIAIIHDISERKETEKLKEGFISTVSHELRTPLTSIKGSLSLLLSGTVGDIPDTAKTMLDISYNNSERLVRLINDILDIDKMSEGQMQYIKKEHNLVEIITVSVENNKSYAEQYGVNYKFESELTAVNVTVDYDRIMQVIVNLLSNAAKFSKKEADVIINLEHEGDKYVVSVKDTGKGISPEFHSRIFQRFSQADSNDSKENYGTGLGLAISKSIITEHDGEISFSSEVDKGSTFYFSIPDKK